jgi:hypothetical protein
MQYQVNLVPLLTHTLEVPQEAKIVESFKKHPFLWGLGAGAVVTGVAGIAMYSSLPMLTKIGLALL